MKRIKKAVPRIEESMKIHFSFGKDYVVIRGPELSEFLAEEIVRSIDFGFKTEDALLLKDERFVLEFIDIKQHTHRRNLRDVRARMIGTRGKAKRTIENLTGSVIVVNGNKIGVIVESRFLDVTISAIESLLHGAKHGNVFSYLEKYSSRENDGDLGLKP